MAFHIITPFSRFQNLRAVIETLEGAAAGNVKWYPVAHQNFEALELSVRPAHWIFPIRFSPRPDVDPCYAKCNFALDHLETSEGDYVGFLCDDDTYDPAIFGALQNATKQVLTLSSRRYGGVPPVHGDTLIAAPKNMVPGRVGLEQVLMRADVAREHRFENHSWADGRLFERLGKTKECEYYPHLHVNWNSLPR